MNFSRSASSVFWGLILILSGVGFFLDSANVINFGDLVSGWWPTVIILFGLMKLLEGRLISALIWAIFGAVILLSTTGVINAGFWQIFWPLILILIGARILFRSDGFASKETADQVSAFSIFGAADRKSESENFKNANLISIFGGSKIDLRKSKLAVRGGGVDVLIIFGGGEIILPKDMPVKLDVFALFGGTEDKRSATPSIDGKPYLHIQGIVLFGGVEIKD